MQWLRKQTVQISRANARAYNTKFNTLFIVLALDLAVIIVDKTEIQYNTIKHAFIGY